MRNFLHVIAILIFGALTACTGTSTEQPSIEERLAERGYLIGPGDQRLLNYTINGWSSVDDEHLIIRSSVDDEYLIELMGPCINLSSAIFVGFSSPTSRVDSFGEVLVDSPGIGRERCNIEDIHRLEDVSPS